VENKSGHEVHSHPVQAGFHQHADGTIHAHDPFPDHHSHLHNHASQPGHTSRRDFLRVLMGGALVGASVMELAYHRAAWARAGVAGLDANLFDLQKVAEGVYFAHARPQAMLNCNAAVFVRSKDVVVVDAHSKPSAATALIAQIKREVTEKPVRYLINSHFHWDHTQGNRAYMQTGSKVDIIATSATKALMEKNAVTRLKESVDAIPKQIEALQLQAERATSADEKAYCAESIRQLKAYQAEMKDYALELPTITFDESYLLRDTAFDLQLEYHGNAHTSGDLFVLCPQRQALATGDASHGWLPNLADGYPKLWPKTIDAVAKADFKFVLGGHGPVQSDRTVMMSQRNYIEELTNLVGWAKDGGMPLKQIQKMIPVDSLKSMKQNGYEAFLTRTLAQETLHFGPMPPLQDDVNSNIRDVYNNLDRT